MDMNDFFAMGFCKAAEENGVDPVQLAKYAATNDVSAVSRPKYKTDGWAPAQVAKKGKDAIPHYHTPSVYNIDPDEGLLGDLQSAVDLDVYDRYVSPNGRSRNPLGEIYLQNNPILQNWFNAHAESVGKAQRAIARPLSDYIGNPEATKAYTMKNPHLMRLAAKIYHDNMASLTNGAPAQVSAPAKK